MNPPHHISTPSSPPTMEPSQTSPVDSPPTLNANQDEQIRPSKRLKSSVPMSPDRHGSTSSSPPTAEPSQPCLIDPVHPSITDMLKNIDPVKQIGSLICLVESHIQKMNALSEVGSSSSEVRLDKLAAKVIDTISTESEKLSNLNAVVESVTLNAMEGMENLYWVFTGLSIATYAVENWLIVGCTEKEWKEVLVKIVELAKKVKEYNERMPDEREKLCNAVGIIAEGAVIFCDYLKREKFPRFWSATTAAAQLDKTNQQLEDVRDSLALSRLQQHWDKDVFLSHSGKQKNFVRQLHQDLARQHVSCFFDEDRSSLPLGERFPSLMFKAAENCKIAVLVLSKEFLCSKWPMRELSAFIEAKKSGKNPNLKLLPIFFMIKPRELSRITKDSPEWQEALKLVRPIHGLPFSEDGNEVDLRKEAVKEICCHLNGINPPKLLEFRPVGIEKQVREVKALLDMEGAQSALAVIVCGFGGMGKSTLAASVIESLDWSSTDFKFCRVAIDRKTQDKTSQIKNLQKDILSYLGGVNVDLKDTLDGRQRIKEALKNRCSLLLIDNVVDKDDIGDLLPPDLSYSGQNTKVRIIITSRENDLKAKVRIMWKEYAVEGLSYETSKSFLSETIEQSQEVENIGRYEEERLIENVASGCRGVPLLLFVFGRYLREERDKDNYQQVLEVLGNGKFDDYRDEDLGTTLMYVYNKIKNVEVQEAFLDICAYFHGWEWNLVADIVDIHVLKELHRKMLVSKGGSGELIVHDILLLMGLKEAEKTRFSNWNKLSDALENDLCLKNVKGISLLGDNHLITFPSEKLEAMCKSLRVLMLGDWLILEGRPCQKAFPNLRYLRVGDITTDFPFNDPSKLDKLRVFLNRSKPGMNLSQLPSSLKRVCHEVPEDCHEFPKLPFQNLSTLKSFIVKTEESVKLPKALHLPASLVDLDLSRCKNLPEDIGRLSALESLILDKSNLKRLPGGFGKLKKLKHLSMNYCSELSFLSDELGMLSSLERLRIKFCSSLQLLPENFGSLRISSLELDCLSSLKELPNGFGNMPFLKNLSIESCYSLMSLPDSFVQLKMLETLKISGRKKLNFLPKTFNLRRCDSFENLPRDFGELTSLERLHLEELPLKSIPDGFGKLKGLRLLSLKGCSQLKTLSGDFESMATLELLGILDCPELEGAMMEKILKLQNCSVADIRGSTKLSEQWKQMHSRIELPFLVLSGDKQFDGEVFKRGLMEALLNGECEVNRSSGQLMERSSLLGGLGEGRGATVAIIILPEEMLSSEQLRCIQSFAEMARKRAESNGWGMLHIVCARRRPLLSDRRPIPTEEEEKEQLRQILLSMPEGCCALSKRVKTLTPYRYGYGYGYESGYNVFMDMDMDLVESRLVFFIGHVVVDMEGSKSFENFEKFGTHNFFLKGGGGDEDEEEHF